MRISTAAIHRNSIDAILEQQTHLARTQNQVTSGKRFQTPADDPIAATRIAALDRTVADNAQYARNSNIVAEPPELREQSLADVKSLLQRARELALQARTPRRGRASATCSRPKSASSRQELMDIANRDDANGEFLFAGNSTGTQPFARGATGVNYIGDQAIRYPHLGQPGDRRRSRRHRSVHGHLAGERHVHDGGVHREYRHGHDRRRQVSNPPPGCPTTTRCNSRAPRDWVVEDDTTPTPVQMHRAPDSPLATRSSSSVSASR